MADKASLELTPVEGAPAGVGGLAGVTTFDVVLAKNSMFDPLQFLNVKRFNLCEMHTTPLSGEVPQPMFWYMPDGTIMLDGDEKNVDLGNVATYDAAAYADTTWIADYDGKDGGNLAIKHCFFNSQV